MHAFKYERDSNLHFKYYYTFRYKIIVYADVTFKQIVIQTACHINNRRIVIISTEVDDTTIL